MTTPTTSAAEAAGPVTPVESDDARGLGSGAGIELQETGDNSSDSAGSAEAVKRPVKVHAELALQGVGLHELRACGILAVGAGVRAHVGDLGAAELKDHPLETEHSLTVEAAERASMQHFHQQWQQRLQGGAA